MRVPVNTGVRREPSRRISRWFWQPTPPLGRLEGMATQYCTLGVIRQTRGDLDEARKLSTKARDLFAKTGMPHMVEEMQGWLDDLPDAEGDRS